MYVVPEAIIPNFFEISQLPYFKVEEPPLDYNLTSKRMLSVRNLTHKHQNILAKIFSYWPKCIQRKEREETPLLKLVSIQEMPIISLQKFTPIITELYQKQTISKSQWNSLISQIQNYKQQSVKLVDKIMMSEYQIKISNKRSIIHNIYYNVSKDCFRIKISFKSFSFEVSPYLGKTKFDVDLQKDFVIKNERTIQKLKQLMFDKLNDYYETKFDEDKLAKYKNKMMQFYQRDLKKVDQNLLELKLKHNYPLLREKRFLPIQFVDGFDGSQLVDPIVSNKNKYCMFGHFTGYNSNNFSRLQNTHCQICGTQIKQIQQNKLLMFLRNNIYNPSNEPIMYCPEFNRFKVVKKCDEIEVASLKLDQLMINQEDSNNQNQIEQETLKNVESENDKCQEESMMKNQQQIVEKKEHAVKQIGYSSFMHICLSIKNMYTLTKSRTKTQPIKEIEYVNFVYNLSQKKNKKSQNILQYFRQFQLADPVRGKYCNHLQFADLRMFYKNAKKKINFYIGEWIYICPICQQEIRDCDLMYLKETLVLIKYMRKLIQPEIQDDLIIRQKKKKKIEKNSIRIIINNVEKKVFVEYYHEQNKERKKEWEEIQKFYATLIDPYIHFSQYSLGLHKKSKRLQAIYNFGAQQQEQDDEKFERLWLGDDKNSFVV